ncbi:MAG: NAD(P)-dependent oxidoreductase [Psychromonas sp.]|nr:NAD(P)-dependent oxidoreductase [Alteromonadales bacterium]MCP5077953.1 NAD(P)-dependent oxidoreductase [Psychromonas sp.]
MKIAIVGAAGWIGNEVLQEAKYRGHEVIALVRNTEKITDTDVEVRQFDITNQQNSLADAVAGADLVVSAVSGRHDGDHSIFKRAAARYLTELPETQTNRLIWVGGAGSLEVAPGIRLVSTPNFPEEYKAESIGMGDALELFLNTNSQLNWTFISPAAELFPGEKQASYRIGKDQLLVDEQGNSQISGADYAFALMDELEQGLYPKQRIAVAY